jgi:hypothetical protein
MCCRRVRPRRGTGRRPAVPWRRRCGSQRDAPPVAASDVAPGTASDTMHREPAAPLCELPTPVSRPALSAAPPHGTTIAGGCQAGSRDPGTARLEAPAESRPATSSRGSKECDRWDAGEQTWRGESCGCVDQPLLAELIQQVAQVRSQTGEEGHFPGIIRRIGRCRGRAVRLPRRTIAPNAGERGERAGRDQDPNGAGCGQGAA